MTILLVSPAIALTVLERGDFDLRGDLDLRGERLDFLVDEEAVGGVVARLGDLLERRLEGEGDRWRRGERELQILEGGDLLVLRFVGDRLRRGERDLERFATRSRLFDRAARSRLFDRAARSRLDVLVSGERREDLFPRSGLDGADFFVEGELERDLDPPRPRLELLLPRPLLPLRPDFSPDFSFLDFSSALLSSLARYSST